MLNDVLNILKSEPDLLFVLICLVGLGFDLNPVGFLFLGLPLSPPVLFLKVALFDETVMNLLTLPEGEDTVTLVVLVGLGRI